MREEPDGNYSMVYEIDRESVINTALVEAGKVLEKQSKTKPAANAPRPAAANVHQNKPKLAVTEAAMNKYMDKTAA